MEGNKGFFRGSLSKWLRTMVIVSSQDLGGWKRPRTPSGRNVLAKEKNGGMEVIPTTYNVLGMILQVAVKKWCYNFYK